MPLTTRHLGTPAPPHFDSNEFTYLGETWRIISVKLGRDRSLDETIYTVKRLSDGVTKDVLHRDLVKKLLAEKRVNENTIKAKSDETP